MKRRGLDGHAIWVKLSSHLAMQRTGLSQEDLQARRIYSRRILRLGTSSTRYRLFFFPFVVLTISDMHSSTLRLLFFYYRVPQQQRLLLPVLEILILQLSPLTSTLLYVRRCRRENYE